MPFGKGLRSENPGGGGGGGGGGGERVQGGKGVYM